MLTIEIETDPSNPRDWGWPGKMICWHSRYNLGDDHNYDNPRDLFADLFNDCATDDEVNALVDINAYRESYWDYRRDRRGFVADNATIDELREVVERHHSVIDLYLYDHSGITMRTRPFGDRWDSGQVGYMIDGDEGAVKVYDQYLTGDVYHVTYGDDSCGDFYGLDADHLVETFGCTLDEAKQAILNF